MTGVQRIVDEVRAQLAAYDQTQTDRLRLLADDYAGACTQAEDRLRRCEELARTGYRGEALYLAELDPPLLDVLSTLSFPERKMWGELTAMYNLPEPPPLSVDRAKILNRVYADYAGLEALVVRLRHLSRARAPQADRAAVLRELCAQDPNCPLWPDQLISLEEELRADIVRQFEADQRAGDKSRVFEFYSALTAPGWRKPAPPPVIAKVATEYLPEVLVRLSAAIGRADLSAARSARAEFDRMARDAMLMPDHPMMDRATALCAQVTRLERAAERDQQRHEALETLREVLIRGGTEDELTEAYDRARAIGTKIPKALTEQYEARVAKYERGRDNRQTIFGIVGIVVGAAVLVAFLILITRRS